MSKNIKENSFAFLNNKTIFTPKAGIYISDFIRFGEKGFDFSALIRPFLLLGFIFLSASSTAYSQTYQPNYFTGNQQPANNYLANSTAFRQEIARMEINVARAGKAAMPLTQVPRLEKNDVLKVRMLEEQVNGMKPDQSNWNWTFLVAFINPGLNKEKEKSVSQEIQFRKTGWYREYSFTVPYDSQPVFFLYSKPNYRSKILSLINKNQEDIRKIGEKTIELSGAYAKIGSFLNELQGVVNMSSGGMYGGYGGYGGYGSSYGGTYGSTYGGSTYGGSTYGGSYGGMYGGYGSYGSSGTQQGYNFNLNLFMNQSVERLARSFNIQLPQCWQNGGYGGYGGQNNFYGVSPDFVGRSQCVAKSVRLEDFDISVSRMLQQGGMLAAAQLTQKYPQLAFWINVAAAALDFILKITKKAALRIVPTVTSTSDNPAQGNYGYQTAAAFSPNPAAPGGVSGAPANSVKISLYAEAPPSDSGFVTAYPLVLQKWQANPDPEVISLPTPVLADACLHPGQNILRSTDLLTDWTADTFTKDFKLVVSSPNGFRKEFPLKKNVGLSGWELNVTKEDLNSFPKINMTLESVVTGMRGFNEIRSPKFDLPLPVGGSWEVDGQSQKKFAVGEKRIVTLRNQLGNCKCLQAVVYKPSFGGQFVFEANNAQNGLTFSPDGKEVSFEVDATGFQPGQGQLELRQYGGEVTNLSINLYPLPPNITDVKIAKGDNRAILTGERMEQLQAVKINGKRAVVIAGSNIKAGENPNIYSNANQINNQSNALTYNLGSYAPAGEKVFVFEDSNAVHVSNTVSIEMELEGNRSYQYPKTFGVSLARPAIIADKAKEVEGSAIINLTGVNNTAATGNTKVTSVNKTLPSTIDLSKLSIFPINSSEISVNLQNPLTDYDFKVENIQIETRVENSQISSNELPKTDFEVFDWKTMKIRFLLSEQSQRILGGRRLQFRIRDRQRGDSDWYTIKQTFVRLPGSISITCPKGTNGNCELKGQGIEYIKQVSVDGGKTWFPQEPATLIVQSAPSGRSSAVIPRYTNRKLVQIRLRDFYTNEGLMFNF